MSPSKQNLFLFFEENEDQSIIDNKLVKLYMNRCIINDDANFEIDGVYNLQKVTEPMFNFLSPLFKENASQRTHKEAIDRDIFNEALEKTSLRVTNSTENHFIIGSNFHSNFNTKTLNRTAELIKWLFNEVKSQEIKSLYVTVLTGARIHLITKETHKIAYDGKLPSCCKKIEYFGLYEEPWTEPLPSKISVNDDFELSIELIQRGRRLNNNNRLFLHPKLDSYQLKLMETKDESFLQSFTNHMPGYTVDVSKEELKRFPESDSSSRYVNCFCIRQSFHLKSI